jgi:hypothetical protein
MGLSDFSDTIGMDQSQVNLNKNLDIDKMKILDNSISEIEDSAKNTKRLRDILLKYYNNSNAKFNLQTPLSLFVNDPCLFYEIFWPHLRCLSGRQYFILEFDSPLDYKLTLDFEVKLRQKKLADLRDNMLYVCSLSERIPILKAFLDNKRAAIIPKEYLSDSIRDFLLSQSDTQYLMMKIGIGVEEIEQLTNEVLTSSLPVFIEFDISKPEYKKEPTIKISLIGKGSINLREADKTSLLRKSASIVKENIVGLPFEEIEILLEIFPKSSSSHAWIYVYSPERYQIREIAYEAINGGNTKNSITNCAPLNPQLISSRIGAHDAKEGIEPFNLKFKISVPKTHKYWLIGLDKLLLTFLVIWFVADLFWLFNVPSISRFDKAFVSTDFLVVTFTLISFVFVARTWFFHEETIYHSCSVRFVVVLLTISALALLYLVHLVG